MSNNPGCTGAPWVRLRTWWAQQLPLPCGRCGEAVMPGSDWHLDHMVPRWAGGTDDTARPSHAYCNMAAGKDHPPRHRPAGLERDVVVTVSRPW